MLTPATSDLSRWMHANAVAALGRGATLGPRAARAELGPWLLVDADTHLSFFNVAVVIGTIDDPVAAVAQARTWFARRGADFCFLLRDREDRAAIEYLLAAGSRVEHDLPALLRHPLAPPPPAPDDLVIQPVDTQAQLAEYAGIGGDEQGIDRSVMTRIAATAFATPGFRLLVGRWRGQAVATSLALVSGPLVGIYNVNVVPSARRRGFGAAMTWAAIDHGRGQGCRAAFLESTPMSHKLYERMGFRVQYHYVQMSP
jgi:GNAT superfamily N-acetyltransferase